MTDVPLHVTLASATPPWKQASSGRTASEGRWFLVFPTGSSLPPVHGLMRWRLDLRLTFAAWGLLRATTQPRASSKARTLSMRLLITGGGFVARGEGGHSTSTCVVTFCAAATVVATTSAQCLSLTISDRCCRYRETLIALASESLSIPRLTDRWSSPHRRPIAAYCTSSGVDAEHPCKRNTESTIAALEPYSRTSSGLTCTNVTLIPDHKCSKCTIVPLFSLQAVNVVLVAWRPSLTLPVCAVY